MWKNPNEVPNNGKDDDNNGYVDDIHGWNFIGGKNGDVGVDNLEVTRVVKKYQKLFEGSSSAENKANQTKMPNEFAIYLKAKESFNKKSIEAKQAYAQYSEFAKMVPSIAATLNGKTLTKENLASITPTTQEEARNLAILGQIAEDSSMIGKSQDEVQKFLEKDIKGALDYYEPQATKQYNLEYDSRSIVGDNYDDINEKYYGNNHYEGPDAQHGTHVSGIIAGLPNGKEIQYGVASKVAKIMTVRAVPDGDERDKDVANAVRYAVDNGAKVINMSFGKAFSPNKEKVWEAFQYAQDKGVLLVHAAGNENENLEENDNFPTNFKSQADAKPFLNNMITVGASTNDPEFLRASFSNYSGKMVDVFAPGDKIYSTVIDGKYEYLQGTSMASPVVAGASAVLLAYMPNLKPEQIIEAFVNTANKSEVNAMLKTNDHNRFDLISKSGGVIDLYKAAQYAYDKFYKATSTVKKVAPKATVKKQKVVKKK
jgi:subtilisin family serine protease